LPQNSYKIQINESQKLHVGSEWIEIDPKSDKEENRERDISSGILSKI
jgi:endonuclease I